MIRERGGAALREAGRSSVAWLGALLAGEWRGAIDQMRDVPHVGWLSLERVLRGTPLAGLETEVAELVLQRGTAALMAAERLPVQHTAPVYLLRGLARWWLGRGHAARRNRPGRSDPRLLARDDGLRPPLGHRLPRRLIRADRPDAPHAAFS